jgi:hypothetical protein
MDQVWELSIPQQITLIKVQHTAPKHKVLNLLFPYSKG